MRPFAVCILAFALSACNSAPDAAPSPNGCAHSAAHDVKWTDAEAPDIITTRSEGPTCAQAVVTLVARNAHGDPLWALAATHYSMSAGDGALPDPLPAVDDAQMQAFLAGWADVTQMRSSELPQWRADAASLAESVQTFSYFTSFDRETYEALRARDLPMICLASAAETSQCVLVDPASRAPALMVTYGP